MCTKQDHHEAIHPADQARLDILALFGGPVANWAKKRDTSAEFHHHLNNPAIMEQVVARRWGTEPLRAQPDLEDVIRAGSLVAFDTLTALFAGDKIPIKHSLFTEVEDDEMLWRMVDYAAAELYNDREFVTNLLDKANANGMPMTVIACTRVFAARAGPGVKRPADGAESPTKRTAADQLPTAADIVRCCLARDAACDAERDPAFVTGLAEYRARQAAAVAAWMAAKTPLLVRRVERQICRGGYNAKHWDITSDGKFVVTEVRLGRAEWFAGLDIISYNVSFAVRTLLDAQFAHLGVVITVNHRPSDDGLDIIIYAPVSAAQ